MLQKDSTKKAIERAAKEQEEQQKGPQLYSHAESTTLTTEKSSKIRSSRLTA